MIPISCSWGDADVFGAVTIEGSTGCVTVTCEDVLTRAEIDCLNDDDGEPVLRDNPADECCTADDCGVEFGCY
ncbi:hypothetical protein L6R49_02415 [Myxococcota bacterium]|nr:hypothetical protein [Myxococcota bacterium]